MRAGGGRCPAAARGCSLVVDVSRILPGAARAALKVFCCVLAGALLPAAPAAASALRVAPLQLNLNLQQPISRIELFNDGSTDTVVDLRIQAWSQVNGRDQLTPTDEVVAIPPVARVAAGKQQLVRVGFRRPELAGARERAYRLVITELPPANPNASTLQLQLRLLVPVFLAPRSEQRLLPLRLRRDGSGLKLEAANQGNVHAKITGIALRDAQQRTLLSAPLSAYLLPGTARSLPVPAHTAGTLAGAQAQVLLGAQLQAETLPVELP